MEGRVAFAFNGPSRKGNDPGRLRRTISMAGVHHLNRAKHFAVPIFRFRVRADSAAVGLMYH